MEFIQKALERHWYNDNQNLVISILMNIILFLPSLLFKIVSSIRRSILKAFNSKKLPVPVIVVGNITVGGSGKTRLCLLIAQELSVKKHNVGIILRGYGGTILVPTIVNKNDDPACVGDESLIYAQHGFPVVCGKNRYEAGLLLLKQHPNIDIIISDDGLQHYQLERDFEICVLDSFRLFGNRQLIPNGPLRELPSRLKSVDAIFMQDSPTDNNNNVHVLQKLQQYNKPIILQKFKFIGLFNPATQETFLTNDLSAVYIICALGDNKRFINYIKHSLNNIEPSKFITKCFIDHYYYQDHDIPHDGVIITTEKDYVKMKKFNRKNIWIVQSNLHIDNFASIMTQLLKKCNVKE